MTDTPTPPNQNLVRLEGQSIRDFLAVPAGVVRVNNIIVPAHRRVRLPRAISNKESGHQTDTVFCFSDRLSHYDDKTHDQWVLWSPDDGRRTPHVLFDRTTVATHFRGKFNMTYLWKEKHGPDYIDITYSHSGTTPLMNNALQLQCARCLAPVYTTVPSRCAQCKITRYCSRQCQVAHWPVHHEVCARLANPNGRLVPDAKDTFITPEAALAMGAKPSFSEPKVNTAMDSEQNTPPSQTSTGQTNSSTSTSSSAAAAAAAAASVSPASSVLTTPPTQPFMNLGDAGAYYQPITAEEDSMDTAA